MDQVSYQTIGQKRGKPRLWIEGVGLPAAGFTCGASYRIEQANGRISLMLDANGALRVSRKSRCGREIPVLDIILPGNGAGFSAGSRVRSVFSEGRIDIAIHHEDRARVTRERNLRTALSRGTVSEASMFTGGGVSTLAIHQAITDRGLSSAVEWVVDSELRYLQVAQANNPAITDETRILVGRAEEIEPAFLTPVHILSFSMPCSGFSSAGRAKHRQRPEDHDGATSLFGVVSAIRAANPAVIISENVVEAKNSAVYALLRAEMERLGYRILERIMDARDTGSVENRRRYWFVAISLGLADGFDFSGSHPEAFAPPRAIGTLLDTGVPASRWRDHAYLRDKAIRDAAAGKGFRRQLLDGSETRIGTIGRHYQKVRSTEPMLCRADGKERLFTPAEHARFKSVPESLVENIPATTAHEILGQSVDARQAYIAMASVLDFLDPVTRGAPGRTGSLLRSPEDPPARIAAE